LYFDAKLSITFYYGSLVQSNIIRCIYRRTANWFTQTDSRYFRVLVRRNSSENSQ